jgi:hypothetical protein
MSRLADLPEEAIVPPPIVTPEQDALRAQLRADREEWRARQGIASDPADPLDPLRMPGESSSAPGFPAPFPTVRVLLRPRL